MTENPFERVTNQQIDGNNRGSFPVTFVSKPRITVTDPSIFLAFFGSVIQSCLSSSICLTLCAWLRHDFYGILCVLPSRIGQLSQKMIWPMTVNAIGKPLIFWTAPGVRILLIEVPSSGFLMNASLTSRPVQKL